MAEVYTPIVIPDTAFPMPGGGTVNLEPNSPLLKQALAVGQITPGQGVDTQFPVREVPNHIIGDSLNTQSKQILGPFTFSTLGAIQIGTYVNGVSGDIRISPNGIVGRNVNGTTTFTIDGTTGNATFLGTIQAGTFIAGDSSVTIDGSAAGGRIVIFISGIPAIIIGRA